MRTSSAGLLTAGCGPGAPPHRRPFSGHGGPPPPPLAVASGPVNHLADETSPYLRQHADNPVEWYPWGDEALEQGGQGGQADLPVHRVRLVPLVPRHGPRELRGRHGGGRPLPVVHLGQGGPGGASRPRFALHGRHPGPHRIGRVAHVRVLHPRRAALLRRHLLPTRGAPRDALVPPGRRDARHVVGAGTGTGAGPGRRPGRRRPPGGPPGRDDGRADRPSRAPGLRRSTGSLGGPRPRRADRPGRRRAGTGVRPHMGRVRAGPEVPPPLPGGALPAAPPPHGIGALPPDGPDHARRHGRRGHVRPPRGGLLPLLDRRPVAGPPLREDADRSGPLGPRLPPCLAGDRPRGLPGRRHRDARLRPAGPLHPAGRPLLLLRRRRRRGRRQPRHLHPRRARGRAPRGAGPTGGRVVRDHRGGQLGGPLHPAPPGRRAAPAAARDRGGPGPPGRRAGRPAAAGP